MPSALLDDDVTTMADLVARLGNIPPNRILLKPLPATEADLLELADARRARVCELIDGVLVEKAMGLRESFLAMWLGSILQQFIIRHDLGALTGEQGTMRLITGRVRIPDLAFFSWDRLPGHQLPEEPIPDLTPDLAIEIISEGNTAGEMRLKRQDYFTSGTRVVWEVDRFTRTIRVYSSEDIHDTLTEADTLVGGDVLPGFSHPVRELFSSLDRR